MSTERLVNGKEIFDNIYSAKFARENKPTPTRWVIFPYLGKFRIIFLGKKRAKKLELKIVK